MRHLFLRLAAAALVAAAAFAVPAPSAHAAACADRSGVTVVVDYGALGGGVGQGCTGAGGPASQQFDAAGYRLTYVQSEPGFVCRVAGAPAADPCQDVRDDGRYWSLWWADGSAERWIYSSYGVTSLRVPAGGSVALVWNDGGGRRAPGVRPPVHAAEPSAAPSASPSSAGSSSGASPTKPTKQPGKQPGKQPAGQPTAEPTRQPSAAPAPTTGPSVTTPTTSSPTPTASGSASGSPSQSAKASTSPTDAASEDASVAPPTSSSTTDEPVLSPSAQPSAQEPARDGGVPTWLVLGMLVAVFGATAAVVVHRRRSTGPPGP